MSQAEQEMWEAIAQQPAPEEPKVKVGDVVYCEGASAILGDVEEVNEDEFGHRTAHVIWRRTGTVEDVDDLIIEDDRT